MTRGWPNAERSVRAKPAHCGRGNHDYFTLYNIVKMPLNPREVVIERPDSPEQNRFIVPDDITDVPQHMRDIAYKLDSGKHVSNGRVNVGFFDCYFIETRSGFLLSGDFREIDPPFFDESKQNQ